jgi:hypothetical protein
MTDVNIIGPDGNDLSFMRFQTLQVSVAVDFACHYDYGSLIQRRFMD